MLQDVIHPPSHDEQLSIDEISSPNISAQILELCDPDLFQDSLQQNSDVTSTSNCCHHEENNINNINNNNNNNSSYTLNNISQALDLDNNINSNSNSTTSTTSNNNTTNNNLPIIFDSQQDIDNDISASIDFTSSQSFLVPSLLPLNTHQEQQFDFSSTQPHHNPLQLSTCSVLKGLSSQYHQTDHIPVSAPLIGASFGSVFEDDCISSIPSYSPSCSYLNNGLGVYMPHGNLASGLSGDTSGLFGGGILLGSEMQTQDLDYQGENGGIYSTDSVQQLFNPQDFQALGTENHKLVAGNSATLSPEISHLEDSTLKVGKLSVEQRKEKIHRYMKKRNERNFSKKIKYACRKTLADSRPRVRGRFAKNDEFGENQRPACSNHETDDEIAVKEEDDMVDSSDIFAHISGLNSFKCNYSIQSLI
ncbi:hypothetical protein RYX36_017844 [Vicia faba]